MSAYVGLDVSLNSISICVIDAAGDLVWRGKSLSEPASLRPLWSRTGRRGSRKTPFLAGKAR